MATGYLGIFRPFVQKQLRDSLFWRWGFAAANVCCSTLKYLYIYVRFVSLIAMRLAGINSLDIDLDILVRIAWFRTCSLSDWIAIHPPH